MNVLPLAIQGFWDDQTSIIAQLYDEGEISLAQTAQNIFAKSLVLIAASYFEVQLKDLVVQGLSVRAGHDPYVMSFCRRKGVDRHFHTWFDWERPNANTFFALFGEDFKKTAQKRVLDDQLEGAVADYIFIGKSRNELVHQNFLTYPFSETADRTRARICNAVNFIDLSYKLFMVEFGG